MLYPKWIVLKSKVNVLTSLIKFILNNHKHLSLTQSHRFVKTILSPSGNLNKKISGEYTNIFTIPIFNFFLGRERESKNYRLEIMPSLMWNRAAIRITQRLQWVSITLIALNKFSKNHSMISKDSISVII